VLSVVVDNNAQHSVLASPFPPSQLGAIGLALKADGSRPSRNLTDPEPFELLGILVGVILQSEVSYAHLAGDQAG
jgi:hypothetical protein